MSQAVRQSVKHSRSQAVKHSGKHSSRQRGSQRVGQAARSQTQSGSRVGKHLISRETYRQIEETMASEGTTITTTTANRYKLHSPPSALPSHKSHPTAPTLHRFDRRLFLAAGGNHSLLPPTSSSLSLSPLNLTYWTSTYIKPKKTLCCRDAPSSSSHRTLRTPRVLAQRRWEQNCPTHFSGAWRTAVRWLVRHGAR